MKSIRAEADVPSSMRVVSNGNGTGTHRAEETASRKPGIERYHEPYQTAPVGLMSLDKRGRITQLNSKAATLLGYNAPWLIGRPFLVFIAKGDIPSFIDLLTEARRNPEQRTIELELMVQRKSIPVQVVVLKASFNDQLIYQVSLIDLTSTKSTEQRVDDILNRWHSLVENAPDIIMTVDRYGRIHYVNRGAWGFSPADLLQRRLIDFVSKNDRSKVEKCISNAFEKRCSSSCEVTEVTEVTEWHSFNFGTLYAYESIPGRTKTVTVTIRDITELKRAETSLRASREQLREFAARIDMVREEERGRIAREIHDELGQALTILKLDLAWVQGKLKPRSGARKKIRSMINDVDQTIDHVRKIVSELRPSVLDDMGLPAAVEWQVNQFSERTGIQITFESNRENLSLSRDTAAGLFRVIQEALTNIVRHADAQHVRVTLNSRNGILRIAVTDDGKGLSQAQIADDKSFGLMGMRERVHRIGGEFNILSGPGGGTRLEIAAPLK